MKSNTIIEFKSNPKTQVYVVILCKKHILIKKLQLLKKILLYNLYYAFIYLNKIKMMRFKLITI
jgi:hypothetical protein